MAGSTLSLRLASPSDVGAVRAAGSCFPLGHTSKDQQARDGLLDEMVIRGPHVKVLLEAITMVADH